MSELVETEINNKLKLVSFGSLTKLGVKWEKLIKANPALQLKYDKYIKARKDWIMVNIDFSQIEVYMLASLSKDPNLIAVVNSGEDVHSKNASTVYKIDYKDIKAKLASAEASDDKDKINYYKMLWDDFYSKRKSIKSLTFSILYGAGSSKVASDLRITIPEAEKLINDFYTAYPKAKEWQDYTFLNAIKNGYIETPLGRKRETPLIKGRLDAYKALVKNDRSASLSLKRSKEYWKLRDEQKQCKNSLIQSTATDYASLAAIKVHRMFKKSKLQAKLYFWVHDSIVFHCHIDDAILAIKRVCDIMEGPTIKYKGDPVNYRVEAEVGYTYEYMQKIERDLIINNALTKDIILEKLNKSLDDDVNKAFKLIIKSTSTEMGNIKDYIAVMKETKSDYFNELVEKLGLGVNTPDEYMSLLNNVTLTEYLESSDTLSSIDEDTD